MASIIEKETGSPDERPVVASIYYNRLAKNVALQADPSVIYAELLQGSYTGALHHADMSDSIPLTTLTLIPDFRPGPSATRGKPPWKRPCIPPSLTIFTLSPTATVTTVLPRLWKNTTAM